MELCCVPLLAGLLVGAVYYLAHNRGYQRGFDDGVFLIFYTKDNEEL